MSSPFSLLLPVYAGDRADFFRKAFSSSVNEQTLPPTEVVVVQDGPVADELRDAIREAMDAASIAVVHIVLEQNVGLAAALDKGIAACSYEIVARIDADDISLPERFARQLPVIESGVDLLGTGMLEFEHDNGTIVGRRIPRVGQAEIEQYARFHDPFSHPTVMYRRDAVAKAGGYQPLGQMEDYWLFARMIAAGARVENLQDLLVMYRVSDGAYARRGGRAQWRSERQLQKALRQIGFTTRRQYVRNIAVRGLYRFVPEGIRKGLYRRFIARGA